MKLDLRVLPTDVRAAVMDIAERVRTAGGRALMVGGSVRDLLMRSLEVKDVDIEVFGVQPEALKRTEHVLFVKDYVRYLLTGKAATDYIEAQGTLMCDLRGLSSDSSKPSWSKETYWSKELVELAGLKMSAMPEIILPTDVVGGVTAAAAAATALRGSSVNPPSDAATGGADFTIANT